MKSNLKFFKNNRSLPVYGAGKNTREWIYVKDNCEAILKVFGKYFKAEADAESCARNPQALADRVYGHRYGNDGQGYLWRGRGFLQCTFKENYAMFANDMNLPEVMKDPDLVATDYPMESALWFFKRNDLNRIWIQNNQL